MWRRIRSTGLTGAGPGSSCHVVVFLSIFYLFFYYSFILFCNVVSHRRYQVGIVLFLLFTCAYQIRLRPWQSCILVLWHSAASSVTLQQDSGGGGMSIEWEAHLISEAVRERGVSEDATVVALQCFHCSVVFYSLLSGFASFFLVTLYSVFYS